jgi:hypothetical protein
VAAAGSGKGCGAPAAMSCASQMGAPSSQKASESVSWCASTSVATPNSWENTSEMAATLEM